MKTKQCKECNEIKAVKDFYPTQGECKECTKARVRKRLAILNENPDFVESERERGREKYHRLEYKGKYTQTPAQRKKTVQLHRQKYPEKYFAINLSQRIKIKKGNHRHHWSYNVEHAKDIIELSISEHNRLHQFLIYDQERKMYRRCDTMELLDTKEKHLQYYKSLK